MIDHENKVLNMEIFRNNKIKIFLTVFLVYLFYIAPDYVNAYTNRCLFLTKAVVDDHTFAIDKYCENTRDKVLYKGHYYVGGAPGLGLMATPLYAILKPLFKFIIPGNIYQDQELEILNLVFTFFLVLLPGALIAPLLYDLLREFDLKKKERLLIVFAASFGTILFFYSTRFMGHGTGAFMLFLPFYILFKSRNVVGKKYLYFLAGLCLGFAPSVEYTLAIGSLLIMTYAFWNFRKEKIGHYFYLILGTFLTGLLFVYYQYACFGSAFGNAIHYSNLTTRIFVLSIPQPKLILELAFGTYRGMFLYMPVLLVSIYGLFVFFKKPEKRFLPEFILITIFYLSLFITIVIFCNNNWPWGGSFGPRFFVCFTPFLMIPIAFALKKMSYKLVFWISVVSIFINWCGVQYEDTDNVFVNLGLFVFRGLNSSLARWCYILVNTYIRKLNVITHFSPLVGLVFILAVIYLIWKKEVDSLVSG